MIAHEKSIGDNPETFISTEPKSSAVGLKTFFFILLSLNVVFFLWEYTNRGNSRYRNEPLLMRKQDPSIDRIILVGENQETKGAPKTAPIRKGLLALKLPDRRDEPPIFESVNQLLSKSITKNTENLIENLLDYESTKRIDAFRNEKFGELNYVSATRYLNNSEETCCSEIQVRLRFRAFDETSMESDLNRKPREVHSASDPEPSDSDHTSALNVPAGNENAELSDGPSPKMCFKLGPRFFEPDFASIAGDLERTGTKATVKSETIEVDTAFIVIYPAGESFEASKANVQLLKQKGLKDQDFWLITKGEMRGDISLGLFKSRERAEFRRNELEKKGIGSRIKPKRSKRRAYFLFISAAATKALHARVLAAGFEASELEGADPAACTN